MSLLPPPPVPFAFRRVLNGLRRPRLSRPDAPAPRPFVGVEQLESRRLLSSTPVPVTPAPDGRYTTDTLTFEADLSGVEHTHVSVGFQSDPGFGVAELGAETLEYSVKSAGRTLYSFTGERVDAPDYWVSFPGEYEEHFDDSGGGSYGGAMGFTFPHEGDSLTVTFGGTGFGDWGSGHAVQWLSVNAVTPDLPQVWVEAVDASAAEPKPQQSSAVDTGTYRIWRSGDTSKPLPVAYKIDGDELTPEDVQGSLEGSVTIQPGSPFADVTITPKFDEGAEYGEEDESAKLKIQPGSYTITGDSATVTIANLKPTISVDGYTAVAVGDYARVTIAVRWPDGTPASGRAVEIVQIDPTKIRVVGGQQQLVTDADGNVEVSVEGLEKGSSPIKVGLPGVPIGVGIFGEGQVNVAAITRYRIYTANDFGTVDRAKAEEKIRASYPNVNFPTQGFFDKMEQADNEFALRKFKFKDVSELVSIGNEVFTGTNPPTPISESFQSITLQGWTISATPVITLVELPETSGGRVKTFSLRFDITVSFDLTIAGTQFNGSVTYDKNFGTVTVTAGTGELESEF